MCLLLTGLILTEYLLPYISDFFGYDLYDNGFFGIALATIVSGAVGIFAFGGLGVAVAPVLIYHIMGYTERMAIVLSKVPTSDILVMTLGIGIGLILANLLGWAFSAFADYWSLYSFDFQSGAFYYRGKSCFT